MWILTQGREELLKVERFRFLALENGDVRILAKLSKGTVTLGEYGESQADDILGELFHYLSITDVDNYAMPARLEEF